MTGSDSDLSSAAHLGSRLVRHAAVLDAAARLHGVARMLDATAAHIAPRLDAAAGAIVRRISPQTAGERDRIHSVGRPAARVPLALHPPARPE
ncbi:hypothetical protein AB0M58_13285 [Streptomyces bobili]|uniref:hypothetical protein n=1 Tax=Streptomyces bobili TaxID=67280 RepID=UPI0034208B2B